MNSRSNRFKYNGWILGNDWDFDTNTGSIRGLVGISCSQLNRGISVPEHSLCNQVPHDSKMTRSIWDDHWGLEVFKRASL